MVEWGYSEEEEGEVEEEVVKEEEEGGRKKGKSLKRKTELDKEKIYC